MSPYHLHCLSKATTGMIPGVWQQSWCARRLRNALAKGVPVTQAILNTGFPDSSSHYRKAGQVLGMTVKQFRKGGDNASVRYTLADCALGHCLVVESERDVHAILLGDDDAMLVADLHALFPATQDASVDANLQQRVREVIIAINSRDASLSLPLDIRRTVFRQQVWQALRTIPCGETVNYQQLTSAIGKPKATRAVVSACGVNKLAIVIPCHRVTRGDGALSGYR